MLNFLQKWVELEVTNDQERFFKSIAALEEAHIPYRQKGISIISIAMDAPGDIISALSGKLGMLPGITTKTVYARTK